MKQPKTSPTPKAATPTKGKTVVVKGSAKKPLFRVKVKDHGKVEE
jgi:hypothetical protein